MVMNCTSKPLVTTKCTDSLAVLQFKLSFVVQIFQTRDLACVLTTGTTTTSQEMHAMLFSAGDAPFFLTAFMVCMLTLFVMTRGMTQQTLWNLG